MTGIPVRHDVAMTGEVTLRGRVLPIGGLKEKLLAALRSGIKTVLIPEENRRDLKEIPDIVTKGMEIIPVSRMDEVLARALVRQPEPIEWVFDESKPAVVAAVDPTIEDEILDRPAALGFRAITIERRLRAPFAFSGGRRA